MLSEMSGRVSRKSRAWVVRLVAVLMFAIALPIAAQDRRTLIRALRTATDFRVRVQAAFAMGNTGDTVYRTSLERGLRDRNPAVRAAAATALGRLGDRGALAALRRARRDSSASVRMQAQRSIERINSSRPAASPTRHHEAATGGIYPTVSVAPSADSIAWPRVRYVVVLGTMNHRTRFRGASQLTPHMRNEVHRTLRLLRGVAVFPNVASLDSTAERQIRRRRLPKLQLDGSLTEVQPTRGRGELSVRCEVSLLLLDDGSIRGMLSGAATGTEPPRGNRQAQMQRLAQQALSAAVRSAMSSAPTALARAAHL